MFPKNRLSIIGGFLLMLGSFLLTHADDTRDFLDLPRLVSDLNPHLQMSVIRGWRIFQTSYARDGIACVHCHLSHDAIKRWAAAYPKVEVFDGTPYQVKGLRQVVFEAMGKHTDLEREQRLAMVEDLVAYIAWWGDGQPITPGYSRTYPPPAGDLAELGAAVKRGGGLFQMDKSGPCAQCHVPSEINPTPDKVSLAAVATNFPRFVNDADQVMCLESFLAWHLGNHVNKEFAPQDAIITDLSAYLVHLAKGKKLHPGGSINKPGDSDHEEK